LAFLCINQEARKQSTASMAKSVFLFMLYNFECIKLIFCNYSLFISRVVLFSESNHYPPLVGSAVLQGDRAVTCSY
jgi:hypothetical protein